MRGENGKVGRRHLLATCSAVGCGAMSGASGAGMGVGGPPVFVCVCMVVYVFEWECGGWVGWVVVGCGVRREISRCRTDTITQTHTQTHIPAVLRRRLACRSCLWELKSSSRSASCFLCNAARISGGTCFECVCVCLCVGGLV